MASRHLLLSGSRESTRSLQWTEYVASTCLGTYSWSLKGLVGGAVFMVRVDPVAVRGSRIGAELAGGNGQ